MGAYLAAGFLFKNDNFLRGWKLGAIHQRQSVNETLVSLQVPRPSLNRHWYTIVRSNALCNALFLRHGDLLYKLKLVRENLGRGPKPDFDVRDRLKNPDI